MESLISGTMAGAGSFRCQRCGYVMTLTSLDRLGECPGCGGRRFARASLFNASPHPSSPLLAADANADAQRIASAREQIDAPGDYILFDDEGEMRAVALTREWTRIGRSLAADVRFDDPTVSRRHALIVRQADGVRVLDDRSLNGVFVNGERVEWRVLSNGDEIVVGRYRMTFVSVAAESRSMHPLDTAAPYIPST